MTNVKCIRCDTINFVADEVCRACGVELLQPLRHAETRPSADSSDPTAETIDSIPPFYGVGDVLGPTLSLFGKNLWLIIKIVFVVVAPYEIFKSLSIGQLQTDWALSIGLFFLQLLCGVLIAPALIYALMKVLVTGKAPGIGESYRWGFSKLGKLILCAAISWLLAALGTLLFIIPGIIIAVVLSLVYPVGVLENHSVSETLRRSRELTRGYRLRIFFGGIVISLISAVISIPISLVLRENGSVWQLNVLHGIVSDTLEQLTTVFCLVVYLSILRTLERGQSVLK
ncbi:MAG TPA: hypothetical protein VJ875_09370 [Pyrinomonadaceae bacterium]|nr:hypothetical protein [Pyrinomonadaceae bacterium]